MATENQTPAAQTPAAESVFQIQRIYLKDISLEQPNSPQILIEQGEVGVDIQLGVEPTQIGDAFYEVNVTANVHTKLGDKTTFMIEATQSGIFQVENLPAEQMQAILNVACPQIVYPYLRGNVSDLIQRAGFPPIHLAEVNFMAMYEDKLANATPASAQ